MSNPEAKLEVDTNPIQKLWQPGHSVTFSWTWPEPEILGLWQPGHSQTQMGSDCVQSSSEACLSLT